jgi:hypothetical protein
MHGEQELCQRDWSKHERGGLLLLLPVVFFTAGCGFGGFRTLVRLNTPSGF